VSLARFSRRGLIEHLEDQLMLHDDLDSLQIMQDVLFIREWYHLMSNVAGDQNG
jgi:hypothetical protein